MAQLILTNESTAAARIMSFPLVVDATDGLTPETGEAAGQPQYSVDGGQNWTNTNGTLVGGTNGAYEVQLTQAEVNQTAGTMLLGRYKSAATAEARAVPIQVVSLDMTDGVRGGMTALPPAAADGPGGLPISDAGGLDLDIALQKGMFANGIVWVDDGGTASTAWPYGSAPYPTTTIANGKTIADANGLLKLHVQGNHTLAAAMEGYAFLGPLYLNATELIDLGGFSVEHSSFERLVITGAGGNAALIGDQTTYTDCYVYAHTDIQGWIYNGRVEGACSLLDTGYSTFHNVLFGSGLACTLTLQAPTVCDIENMAGELTLAGMDGGVCSVSMSRGAILTIDNTCTAGTITVTGAGTITDNSNGSTVTMQVAEADAIQLGGSTQSATDLKSFADAGYDPATNKITGVADGSIVAASFATDTDTYQAKVDWIDDNGAGTPADHYVVAWYKNAEPVISGITTPLIQVVKVSDGTDQIAQTAMTQIGATGLYRYDATSTARLTNGLAYYALVTATIGGSARTWYQPVGRDSTA